MKKIAAVLTLVLMFQPTAHANNVWFQSRIAAIYPNGDGTVVLTFADVAAGCTNSSSPKYFYLQVGQNGMTQEGLKNIMSVALTAAVTDKTVSVVFDDSSQYCYVNSST